jgi:polyisoprenoid-binding protein YceI
MRKLLICAALLQFNAVAAEGAPSWTFSSANSRLLFQGSYEGSPIDGKFAAFNGTVTWHDKQPTKFEVEIEVASLDSEYAERDEVLKGNEWLDVEQHPKAHYRSTADCALTEGALLCPGELSLRGITKAVPLRIFLDGAKVKGEAEINRKDFAIGTGEWDELGVIGERISVSFELSAD